MSYRDNPLTPQDAPALAPLENSQEFNELESELKKLFMFLWQNTLRGYEDQINAAGMAHLGPVDLLEQAIKSDGLALVRKADEESMRYAFKAWRARNPKRGLHMLRCYLQMLWPNGWKATQMWAPKGGTYPEGLVESDGGNHYLTSRVQVEIDGTSSDGADVLQVANALRSVVPARIVLSLNVVQRTEIGMAFACAYYRGASVQSFTGTCK